MEKAVFLALLCLVLVGVCPAHAADEVDKEAAAKIDRIVEAFCPRRKEDQLDEIQKFKVGEFSTLYLVQCARYAYQESYITVVERSGDVDLMSIAQPLKEKQRLSWAAGMYLMNAGFEPKTKTLNVYNKGRGVADCGSAAEYRFDEDRWLLKQAWLKACDTTDGQPFEPAPKWRIYSVK